MNSSNQNSASSSSGANVQEFSIRAPKNQKKKFNIMRFNSNLNMDLSKWTNVKMERENNKYERIADDSPKFGAGSEYRKEEKEEARKKRLGYMGRKYNPDDQPWMMKCGGKNGKKFRGVREGGVNDNTAYYVFTHGNDGSIEAYPVGEWYNFQAVQRFKALTAEEAELEFGKRNKSLNYFSLMMKKRFNNEGDEEAEAEEGKRGKKKGGDFKISDMDDWVGSGEDESNEDDDENVDSDEEAKKKKKRKPVKSQAKKKKANDDDSAQEESDDGDEEGRELDYISDSSISDSDHEAQVDKDMKGVADEDALRKLLTSDEDSEEEDDDKKKDGNSSELDETANNEEGKTDDKNKKKRKRSPGATTTVDGNIKNEDSASDFSRGNSDSETERSNKDSTSSKSGETAAGPSEHINKRLKTEKKSPPSDCGISEEAVRRYLARKPMTATELLTKFKKPRTNLSSEQLVNVMTQILKKINPVTQTIKGKMYLALNTDQKHT